MTHAPPYAARIAAAALLLLPHPTRADEEQNTQAPLPSPRPAASVGFGAARLGGDNRRARELLRLPESPWVSASVFAPWDDKTGRGHVVFDVFTFDTGGAHALARLKSGIVVEVHLRRDRRPHAPYAGSVRPIDIDTGLGPLGRLETSHERLEGSVAIPIRRLDGSLRLAVGVDRRGGTLPSLVAGRSTTDPLDHDTFGTPSYREIGDNSLTLSAELESRTDSMLLQADAFARQDGLSDRLRIDDRLGAATLDEVRQSSDERRRSIDLGIAVADIRPHALHTGASYRVHVTRGVASDGKTRDTRGLRSNSYASDAIDLSSMRHRAVFGAAWNPSSEVRADARIEGETRSISTSALEHRDVPTLQVNAADAALHPWSVGARTSATHAVGRLGTLEAEGAARAEHGGDDWTQRLLLIDRATAVRVRLSNATRDDQLAWGEARAIVAVVPRTRFGAGVRLEGETLRFSRVQTTDAPELNDRDRRRVGGFVQARSRLRDVVIDGRFTSFVERRRISGATYEQRGIDARASASGSVGPIAIFATGALTDNRFVPGDGADLTGGGALRSLAPAGFEQRSWVGAAGASLAVASGAELAAWITQVQSAADFRSTLSQGGARVGLPVAAAARVSIEASYLRFGDAQAPWTDSTALLAYGAIGGQL